MNLRNKFLATLGTVALIGGALVIGGQLFGNVTTLSAQTSTTSRPYLGITAVDVTPALASNLGLAVNQGAYILEIAPGSPAAKAGLQAANQSNQRTTGDVITALDTTQITNVASLSNYLNVKKEGDSISISVLRNGQTIKVTAILAAWPANIVTPIQQNPTNIHHQRHLVGWVFLVMAGITGILLLTVLVLVIVWLARRVGGKYSPISNPSIAIAKERYARGEISGQEYEQLRKDLS
jgi:uncharacterized membrane protein